MIECATSNESWWGRIQELHGEIVTQWVRCRTAQQPLALEIGHLVTLLQSAGFVDRNAPAAENDHLETALIRVRAQLTWGVRKINQFQLLSQTEQQSIRELSQEWLSMIQNHCATRLTEEVLREIRNATHAYLQQVESLCLDPVAVRPISEEYSAEVQLKVLHLDAEEIGEPVLDIGCGKDAGLVHWLRRQRVNAIGIDLCGDPSRGSIAVDWFEFPFVPEHFGTIIAHLSYSLQFLRHHLDPNGDAERFAKQYMNILRALRVGGRLVYAPGLPFIERLLPVSRYRVTRYPIEDFAVDSQAAEAYAEQLGEDPIYACHVERI